MTKLRRAALAALLAGCVHGEPFTPGTYTPPGPYSPGSVTRLTFNLGTDRTPAWLPDGSGILYSLERFDRPDRDRCLAELPAAGGAIRRLVCTPNPFASDSADEFLWFAAAADGRLAYVRASTFVVPSAHPTAPDHEALVLATLGRPLESRDLQQTPYLAPSGLTHGTVAFVQWLDANRLVYVGQRVVYQHICLGCAPFDTLTTGVEVATLDLSGPTPVVAIVPGSDNASSVTVGATPDTIYFTKNGDARVYWHAFSSGQTAVAYDFGAAGIARDVHVRGPRLVAVVGGVVIDSIDPTNGHIQVDSGGPLFVADLVAGTDSMVADATFRFRRPALSPDGRSIVAERRLINVSDLWLVALP